MPVRGAQDGDEHCRLLSQAQGSVWPGRSRDQSVKVKDCRMNKPRDTSCSLPHIAHVDHNVKLGVRAGGEEMRLKVLVQGLGAGLTKKKKIVRVSNLNPCLCLLYTAAICGQINRLDQP